MTFAAGFLLLIWVVASILVNGIALLHYLTKLRGLELLGYGAAAGVVLHALLGLRDRCRSGSAVGICRNADRSNAVERGLPRRAAGPAGIFPGIINAQ